MVVVWRELSNMLKNICWLFHRHISVSLNKRLRMKGQTISNIFLAWGNINEKIERSLPRSAPGSNWLLLICSSFTRSDRKWSHTIISQLELSSFDSSKELRGWLTINYFSSVETSQGKCSNELHFLDPPIPTFAAKIRDATYTVSNRLHVLYIPLERRKFHSTMNGYSMKPVP